MIFSANINQETYTLSEVAKILNIRGLGRNKMIVILRELEILDCGNFAKEEYVHAGYFSFRSRIVDRNHIYNATSVQGIKGVNFIREQVEDYLKKGKENE